MAESQEGEVSKTSLIEENLEKTRQTSEFSARSILVLAASSLSLFSTVGFLNAFGVFQTYYTAHYLPHTSNFQVSWIGSFAIFLLFALGPIAGYCSDKLGPTVPITIGIICELVAIFMISLCRKYYEFFLAQGVLLGLALSLIAIPTTSVTPLYFQRNRGFAQGVSIAGSSLGGILFPIIIDELLNKDGISFGWTIRIVGFILIPLLLVVVVGIRRPRSVSPKPTPEPKSGDTVNDDPIHKATGRKEGLQKLRHPSFVLLCAGLAVFYFGFFAPFFFVSSYGVVLGASESFSIYLISILNAASLFGRILPGMIADRLGHFNIMVFSIFASCIICFCWTAVTSIAGLIVWALAYGFASGAVLSLQFACTSLVATKETMGTAFGILMASIALTTLFGTPIAGELVKHGYLALSVFAGATMLTGGVLVLLARFARDRNLLVVA